MKRNLVTLVAAAATLILTGNAYAGGFVSSTLNVIGNDIENTSSGRVTQTVSQSGGASTNTAGVAAIAPIVAVGSTYNVIGNKIINAGELSQTVSQSGGVSSNVLGVLAIQ